MKRLLAVVVGVFGLRALLRRRARPALSTGSSSPAADLKARLAESRSSESHGSESYGSESYGSEASSPEPEAIPEPTVDEKRVDVHNRARGAIDELKS